MIDLSDTQILGAMTTVIGGGVAYLIKRVAAHEKRCTANEKQCREDAQECHTKIETLLSGMLKNTFDTNSRQEALMADLKHSYDRGNNVMAGFSSSGNHPAIRLKRKRRS